MIWAARDLTDHVVCFPLQEHTFQLRVFCWLVWFVGFFGEWEGAMLLYLLFFAPELGPSSCPSNPAPEALPRCIPSRYRAEPAAPPGTRQSPQLLPVPGTARSSRHRRTALGERRSPRTPTCGTGAAALHGGRYTGGDVRDGDARGGGWAVWRCAGWRCAIWRCAIWRRAGAVPARTNRTWGSRDGTCRRGTDRTPPGTRLSLEAAQKPSRAGQWLGTAREPPGTHGSPGPAPLPRCRSPSAAQGGSDWAGCDTKQSWQRLSTDTAPAGAQQHPSESSRGRDVRWMPEQPGWPHPSSCDAKGPALMASLSRHSHQRDKADAAGAWRNRSFIFSETQV